MELELDVQLAAEAADLPAGADFEGWIRAALQGAAGQGGALSLRLVGLEEGAELNSSWRRKDGPTNVLAFPGPGGLPAGVPREYGDLVICLPVVLQEAAEQGKAPVDHLAHLVVHGTLHLLGYTHDGEADAGRMEALETRVLARLGIADPYVQR
ncbi:MAG: rRNA maturation RNase YbeY [Gammaproteobacteria bacterium]